MSILIAIFSILWGILICIDNLWNIWRCIPIGLGIFILIYGFFWLCMFSADKIVNGFAKVYNEMVIPRIQQKGIDKYKEENPQIQLTILIPYLLRLILPACSGHYLYLCFIPAGRDLICRGLKPAERAGAGRLAAHSIERLLRI